MGLFGNFNLSGYDKAKVICTTMELLKGVMESSREAEQKPVGVSEKCDKNKERPGLSVRA